ncbi:inorganic phosphate transporter [Pseudozyma hubeiensis SY62]|uniref:Inorganic phosphate transporter n=1 Tax=Pseudozyma hubeiensis (strain SY62) TaxID=1305764 RepID=R9PDX1_PSEHS|nr:inorganic phosphate transporter [Pseudozyma hubeiensis SY62]GAC99578.1 inorganic phosphate transporter [Pseudozyma hubeiensis SY62]
MPFGSSMDAWASFYDYPSDEIEEEDAVGSARASSELDHAEASSRGHRISTIRMSPLAPNAVVFSALQPMQPPHDRQFSTIWQNTQPLEPFRRNDMHSSDLAANLERFQQDTDSPLAPRHTSPQRDSKIIPHAAEYNATQTGLPRQEETFSYNTTPPLALVERRMAKTWIGLTWGEIKLLSLAGAGFFMDSYDLFIINMVYPILLLAYYPVGVHNIEWGLAGGVLKASASMGNVVGQLLFGFLGDFWGRSVLYGKELMLAMAAIILMISAPDSLHGQGVTIWIAVFRFLMGIGIGGDYPLSATVVADRSSSKTRGLLLSLIFSNQGWGALFAALASLAVVGAYRSSILSGNLTELSGAWRILLGLPLAPGFAVLYFRLTLVESARFLQARYLQDHDDLATHASAAGVAMPKSVERSETKIAPASIYTGTHMLKKAHNGRKISETPSSISSPLSSSGESRYNVYGQSEIVRRPSLARPQLPSPRELREAMRKAATQSKGLSFRSIGVARNDFWEYFSEWSHLRVLIGTSLSWFLVDITFYGINLNQSAIFSLIGYTQGSPWHRIYKLALGNLIVVLAGFLPGYYLTVAFIEVTGRKKIQLFGFAANSVLFLVLALTYNTIIHQAGPFFAVFVLLQLSFNFGSNSTTFVVPAEVFPTRIRATAHGFCAAMGKLGSIVSSLGFSVLANDPRFGHTGIFWLFLGVSLLGLIVTLLMVPETKGYDADAVDRQELLERSRMA